MKENNSKVNKNSLCNLTTYKILIGLMFFVFIIFVRNYIGFNENDKVKLSQYEYKIDKIKLTKNDSIKIDISNNLNIIKSDIEKIEISNDKRFEVLGWSFGIMCSFVLAILLINWLNSKTILKDTVLTEFDKKYKENIDKTENALSDLEKIKGEYQEEIDRMKKLNKELEDKGK